MTIEERIKDRNIGIIGMARSGVAAAVLAESFGGRPFVSDAKQADTLQTEISRLQHADIPFETGGHSDRLLDSDYIIISPGVPLTVDIVKKASQKGIPIFSEIEFASWCCKGTIIAVTGSNGKTTTTTLLGEIFAAAGYDTFVAGNIGLPFAELVPKIPEKGIVILEVSNFQLETISDFKPQVAVILNLTPDHLDRHGTFENYVKAKFRITENQDKENYFILNQDDPETAKAIFTTNASLKYFSAKNSTTALTFVNNEKLMIHKNSEMVEVIPAKDIVIPGPHNLQNAAAAVAVGALFDIAAEVMAKVLRTFHGVEHRMENVGSIAGINFINDSKATNVDSVCYALRSIKTELYLIAGGRDKDSDFTPILEFGKHRIKSIIAIGEARDKIFNSLGTGFPVIFTNSLEEAVQKAFELAAPGETIMLSPGCASFDMFDNFEQRGRRFKQAVLDLKNGKDKNETVSKN